MLSLEFFFRLRFCHPADSQMRVVGGLQPPINFFFWCLACIVSHAKITNCITAPSLSGRICEASKAEPTCMRDGALNHVAGSPVLKINFTDLDFPILLAMEPSVAPMAPVQPPLHPILRELATLQQVADIIVDFDPSNYQKCRGYATSKKQRCGNGSSKTNQEWVGLLLERFERLKECPSTEDFYGDFEILLELTHCGLHRPVAKAKFVQWRELRDQESSSSSGSRAPVEDPSLVKDISMVQGTSIIQDTTVISSIESLSDVSITPPSTSPTVDDSQTTVSPPTSPDPNTHKTVVQDFSSMSLNTNGQSGTTPTDDTRLSQSDVEMIGGGLKTLQRKGSLRDDSPVIREIYRYLTPEQKLDGIVYVLDHLKCPGLFKISSSTGQLSEEQRGAIGDTNPDGRVIHETQGGPFFGASKAERLAQVVLQHHSLLARECQQCGERHEGWMKAPIDMVCETVVRMEQFVQIPAYSLQDGEMKLSPAADKIFKAMCSFLVKRLDTLMASEEVQTSVSGNNRQEEAVQTRTVPQFTGPAIKRKPIPTTVPVTRSISFQEVNKEGHLPQDNVSRSQDTSRRTKPRQRKRDSLSRLFKGRSRENTPEEVELQERRDYSNIPTTASPPPVNEEVVAFNVTLKTVVKQAFGRS